MELSFERPIAVDAIFERIARHFPDARGRMLKLNIPAFRPVIWFFFSRYDSLWPWFVCWLQESRISERVLCELCVLCG